MLSNLPSNQFAWDLVTESKSNDINYSISVCPVSSLPHLKSSSSSETTPVRTEIYQHARKVVWLHTGFAFSRFYFEFERRWMAFSLARKTRCTTQSCQNAYCTGKQAQKTVHGAETPHFHILCIAKLLRCFLYFGSFSAGFLSVKPPALHWEV